MQSLYFSLANLILVAGIGLYAWYLTREDHRLKKEKDKITKELAGVTKKAEAVLAEAVEKSGEILGETEIFREKLEQNLKNVFEMAISKNVAKLEKDSEEVREVFKASFEKILGRKVDQAIATAQGQIDDYKATQIEGLEEKVQEKVQELAKEVLGKAISLSEHEDLVMKSLEKAKKEGIL